jgi:hypothetical protein
MKPFHNLVLALVLALGAFPLAAEKPATAPADAAKGAETAVFSVPGLKDEAVVKSLTVALAKEPGVMSAKADAAAGKFLVTFEPGKTGKASLEQAMAKVVPAAKLEKIGPADAKDAAKHDCGKCPSKATCEKKS